MLRRRRLRRVRRVGGDGFCRLEIIRKTGQYHIGCWCIRRCVKTLSNEGTSVLGQSDDEAKQCVEVPYKKY